MTHVLDADAFHSAIEKTKEKITSQTAQIKQLETAVKGIIDLEDAFRGEGGEAIRYFYEKHHLPVMSSYSAFLAHYQTTLDSMKKSLHNLEPSRSGYIRRSFLDQQVEQDLTRARERTSQLTNEANATINRVADIVALPKIDDTFFAEMVEKARREKNQTSEQLSEFDHRQASLLTNLENELQTVVKKVNDLQNLFQPATVKTDGQVQGASCEKPANTDVKEDKNILQIIGDVFVGIAEGIYQFVRDLFVGISDLINAILTDFPGLVMGIVNAVIHIDETIGAMIGALEAAWERDVINGDARSRARFFTYGIVSGVATYYTRALDKLSTVTKLSKLGKLAEAEKPKSIPFNVMDTAKLKDYMKENVIKEAHRYKKQISDFVQSNLFKTIVNMKALSNQAADIFRKAKHVLNPEKINVLLKKTYEDVVKGPLVRTKMGIGRIVDGFLDTKMGEVLDASGMPIPFMMRDIVENSRESFVKAKDTIVNATESVGKVVGDISGKIGEVFKTSNNINTKKIDEFIEGTIPFDNVVDDFARLYSEKIQTNKTWSWNKSFHGGEHLTARQKKLIKEKAIADGLIPNVNIIKADGMRYGYADFKNAGLVVETKILPEKLWLKSDDEQFEWLDNAIGGRPEGMTWHHTEVPGTMELVPFGIHNITIHNGGRSTGLWADAPR
ncbi:T7SS effector LXG polymorphic toxin [Metabacillus indicus]|uniref:T7SS effector LXG polymorphic toxin n=1 Tax=Metabacillus indicus TaxID=246786 RepID=UPI0009DD2936|nr:T7SS effector LXG polymorphic toxin [Metabacillus indicus]